MVLMANLLFKSSCWVFAATSIIESGLAKKNGTLYVLSEQEIIDCDTKDRSDISNGCNGGWLYGGRINIFIYVEFAKIL